MVAARLSEAIASVRGRPGDAAAWAELAELYQAHLFLAESLECYQHLAALRPLTAQELYRRSLALFQSGADEQAIDVAEQAARLDPHSPAIFWRRGLWLLQLGRIEEAQRDFERAFSIDPDSAPARAGVARVHLQRREGGAAESVIREHLLAGPHELYARQLLASALRQQGRLDEAAREMARSRSTPPAWPDPWLQELLDLRTGYDAERERANALLGTGRAAQAEQAFLRILRWFPNDPDVTVDLANAVLKLGRSAEAFALYEKVLREDASHARAHFNMGAALTQTSGGDRGVLERAIAHFDAATRHDEAYTAAWEAKGQILQALGRHDEALSAYARVLDVDPGKLSALSRAGQLCVKQGRWPDAASFLERLVELTPNDDMARLWLARARIEAGDAARARALVEELSARLPNHPHVQALQSKLAGEVAQGDGR